MNYILFDPVDIRENLLPFTYTRPVSEIRIGILTIKQKWDKHLNASCTYLTALHLQQKFTNAASGGLYINGSCFPTNELTAELHSLQAGMALVSRGIVVGFYSDTAITDIRDVAKELERFTLKESKQSINSIAFLPDIFSKNGDALQEDFTLITKGRKSAVLSETNTVIGSENIFVEEGAYVEGAILNGKTGPVYIGMHTEVMEGAVIRGPFALCEHSSVKMSAKIYGPTTIGPYSKVGGEISNSVIFGYSNKGHDGFLGNSVIGEWCNLGAGTNNSNLKNNYSEVKIWSHKQNDYIGTGLQFCGLFMGDHSKCGINTMFNTGTVVGVAANIYGGGFPDKFIPSYAWGGSDGYQTYRLKDAIDTASRVLKRRNIELGTSDKDILSYVFEETGVQRKWEN